MYTESFMGEEEKWTEELCPFCTYSHLTETAHRIVTSWLEMQVPAVREVTLVLGADWYGTWLELQLAAVKLALSD
jgi:hypothetical protein